MTTLTHEILIQAPLNKVWSALEEVDLLDTYDPTVSRSTSISTNNTGLGASRKVEMKDGKNWFREVCTRHKPNQVLQFELTSCSFPVKKLDHTYTFEERDNGTVIRQVMNYRLKHGLIGKIMDNILVRRKYSEGIQSFLEGLKKYTENSK